MVNRTIKFRVWDAEQKKMRSHDFLSAADVVYSAMFDKRKRDCINIMQFTGLLDKEGKEIYEGDIMSLGTKFQYVVRFEDAKFVVYHTLEQYGKWGDLRRAFDPDFREYNFRVVGNIFENKDLLP